MDLDAVPVDAVPITEAKAHLSELVDRVEREHARLTVTRNGRPAAVLVSSEDLASLEETVEILEDRKLMDSLRRSRREATAGRRVPVERPR